MKDKKSFLLILLILSAVLQGCVQSNRLPPLPPTVALAKHTSSPSATSAQPLLGNTPQDTETVQTDENTPDPDLPTLSDQEIKQTLTAQGPLFVVQTTFAVMQSPSPTETPCPAPPCKSPTPTWSPPKTKTPTLTPTATTQLSDLHIQSPGPLSRVTSPIHLVATGLTGAAGMIRVELIGENGQLMMRQILRYGTMLASPFLLNLDIPFEIPVVAESARLVVSVDDARSRMISLTSADVILLSIGDAQINPGGDSLSPIIIKRPVEGVTTTTGFMVVQGQVRALSTRSLILEVYTDDGVLVGSRQANVVTPLDGAYHSFEAIVPYIVSQARGARLVVRQESDGSIPGNVALSSITLTIKP